MELNEAIKSRTTIRKFSDYYVNDKELKELMEAAQVAPSWANTQVWDIIIARDREIIEKITSTFSENNPARKGSFSASALLVICAKQKVSGYKKGEKQTKFSEWFMFDLGMAVQNICLRAHDLGLGTVVVGSLDHDTCHKELNVPTEQEVVVVLPIGKPLDIERKTTSRKQLQDFVHLNIFGEKYATLY